MMVEQRNALDTLDVGHIFHAESYDGVPLVCLVTAVCSCEIEARTITSQISLTFNRQSGTAKWGPGVCRIDAVAPLPIEVYNILAKLDAKYQKDSVSGFIEGDSKMKLSDVEKRALLFTRTFYLEHRISINNDASY